MEHVVVAHSAGAQMTSRYMYLGSLGQAHTVAANAGTWLFPDASLPFPYGLGGLPEELTTDEVLR
jgi:hypothetical protein